MLPQRRWRCVSIYLLAYLFVPDVRAIISVLFNKRVDSAAAIVVPPAHSCYGQGYLCSVWYAICLNWVVRKLRHHWKRWWRVRDFAPFSISWHILIGDAITRHLSKFLYEVFHWILHSLAVLRFLHFHSLAAKACTQLFSFSNWSTDGIQFQK